MCGQQRSGCIAALRCAPEAGQWLSRALNQRVGDKDGQGAGLGELGNGPGSQGVRSCSFLSLSAQLIPCAAAQPRHASESVLTTAFGWPRLQRSSDGDFFFFLLNYSFLSPVPGCLAG